MTRFRGCIDIHSGQVKQIVGGTLSRDDLNGVDNKLSTNFVSTRPSSYYANLYKENNITGTHVIKLGTNEANDRVALEALRAWPDALQIGGSINDGNAKYWIENGASHVIITSWLFPDGKFSLERLEQISNKVGSKHLVIDLSCRCKISNNGEIQWFVAINKWQTITDKQLSMEFFKELSPYCDEFLVHAADVEGLCKGIDQNLVSMLGKWCNDKPVTYAGGANSLSDLTLVEKLSQIIPLWYHLLKDLQ
ncbi:hypothetical protein PACTADRAFT_73328 [Pachysolen tannophilus NRRL Y-2460]|uniref:1-(5-phosphoribosyl)-5-[(5-phosphoribosylamino)methylideneamino] imidazole-4-carboxamide isomerase n=1 Tax=Pachysolen tannophilus NRRL Y-2460 TaxID=669874 RepID=A0A1E4U0U8_PACTA|nr:hypothetical protein PACTADRAFT_73328 [Pachysolen tannophilus NRRL Y-2460]